MDNFEIQNNNKITENKEKEIKLSEEERERFHNDFNKINSLINDSLEDFYSSELTSESKSIETDSKKDEPVMEQSYNNAAKLHQERMRQIGIIKQDPTGKNFKASGEDI
jgi:hypothetical protein